MIPAGPTEVVNRLIDAVSVQVGTIGIVAECPVNAPHAYCEALNNGLRSSPGDSRQLGNTRKIQLRHVVTNTGQLAGLQVVKVVEAEPEFIDRCRGEQTRVGEHRLVDMRVHVVLESQQVRRELVFAAPAVPAEPIGPGGLREVDALYKLILIC